MIELASTGLALGDVALAINRVAVGLFFAISGYHKLFNDERHASLMATLERDHVIWPKFNVWLVPSFELGAGLAVAIGLMAPLAAIPLIIIMVVALCCEGPTKVARYKPIDLADAVDDWLYIPDVLYIIMLVTVVLAGPGALAIQ